MSSDSNFPFYSHLLFLKVINSPKGSPEWVDALDKISQHIKDFEAFLSTVNDLPLTIETDQDVYYIDNLRICVLTKNIKKPIIELQVNHRLIAYNDFPEINLEIEKSQAPNDRKTQGSDPSTLLEMLKNALNQYKKEFGKAAIQEEVLRKLKELKATAPHKEDNIKKKANWFKELAKLLMSLKFFEPALNYIKQDIPKIWNQLTFKQKLQVASLLPVFSAGAVVGGVGIAGLGNAVGIPGITVILVLLFLTNGLIDFIDFCINLVGDSEKLKPDYEATKCTFEKIFFEGMSELFKTKYTDESFNKSTTQHSSGDKARDYEFFAVERIAQEFRGKGYVSPKSRDGGIDGYVICLDSKEVILVQTKYYSKKVGFAEATQYLGTLKYWQKEYSAKFDFPITKMIITSPTDFSIEAKRVSKTFEGELMLMVIQF